MTLAPSQRYTSPVASPPAFPPPPSSSPLSASAVPAESEVVVVVVVEIEDVEGAGGGGMVACAYSVGASANMAFSGAELGVRVFKKRTVSSVFWMSGILSRRLVLRRWVESSMNWYFLYGHGNVPVVRKFIHV